MKELTHHQSKLPVPVNHFNFVMLLFSWISKENHLANANFYEFSYPDGDPYTRYTYIVPLTFYFLTGNAHKKQVIYSLVSSQMT